MGRRRTCPGFRLGRDVVGDVPVGLEFRELIRGCLFAECSPHPRERVHIEADHPADQRPRSSPGLGVRSNPGRDAGLRLDGLDDACGPAEAAAQPERDVDERDEHGHLDQRADDAGERLAGGGAEDADGDGDRELEVVGGDGEGEARGLRVREARSACPIAKPATHMTREVDEQRQRDPGDVERLRR